MKVDGKPMRTIWVEAGGAACGIIDQTRLPHRFETVRLSTVDDTAHAIRSMQVRGAPLIGATAAYAMWLAMRADASDEALDRAYALLIATRPTAINLKWALDEMVAALRNRPRAERVAAALKRAGEIADEDVAINQAIGRHGMKLIEEIAAKKRNGDRVNVLTHCNAGWLATVDWGTATAPIYMAHDRGVPVHVFVDETRPRNQGAALTAFELGHHGVPHQIVVDNAGGHLMQHGKVDLVIVGADRDTARGDAANKIGTYLKALAARANQVPFYVAVPQTTIDWTIEDGVRDIEIEERDSAEVTHIVGRLENGDIARVAIGAPGSPALNPAFDVTPAELVTGLITDRGVSPATRDGLLGLFPERKAA
jgi:methylthioribose-1-phosphate isomerase